MRDIKSLIGNFFFSFIILVFLISSQVSVDFVVFSTLITFLLFQVTSETIHGEQSTLSSWVRITEDASGFILKELIQFKLVGLRTRLPRIFLLLNKCKTQYLSIPLPFSSSLSLTQNELNEKMMFYYSSSSYALYFIMKLNRRIHKYSLYILKNILLA